MINKILLLFILSILSLEHIHAQFIDIQITIEPELSATVVNDLNFGQIATNTGENLIELGSTSMGIFSITGFKNQRVFLEVTYPNALLHQDPLVNAEIPLTINLAANNTGVEDYRSSFPINNDNALVNLHESSDPNSSSNDQNQWKVMYLYVYGSLIVGNIPNGRYQGDIYLSVEYD